MNRGLMIRLIAAGVWLVATFAAFDVFENGPRHLDDRQTLIILAGLAVIFALDVWGWVRRDGD